MIFLRNKKRMILKKGLTKLKYLLNKLINITTSLQVYKVLHIQFKIFKLPKLEGLKLIFFKKKKLPKLNFLDCTSSNFI